MNTRRSVVVCHDLGVGWRPLPTPDGDSPAPRALRDSLDTVLKGLGSPPAEVRVRLHDRWDELVGPEAAVHCRPGSLEDGRLVIEVGEPAWASQLRWQSAEVIRRSADLLGDDVIQQVEIRVSKR